MGEVQTGLAVQSGSACHIGQFLVLPIHADTFYEARPQSKFPWGRLQKQNTISWKYLLRINIH
jgi:hypothetical protein